jgi:hypothetical protein
MTQKYPERLYKAIKSQYEADVNRAMLKLDQLFNNDNENITPTYYTDLALTELIEAQQKLKTLEEYINGSKPLKQLLND